MKVGVVASLHLNKEQRHCCLFVLVPGIEFIRVSTPPTPKPSMVNNFGLLSVVLPLGKPVSSSRSGQHFHGNAGRQIILNMTLVHSES